MARGAWDRGTTAVELADEWGCAVSTVENYSSEASRWLKMLIDPDFVRTKLAGAFEQAVGVVTAEMAAANGDKLQAAKALPGVANGYADLVGASKTDKSASVTVNNVQLEVQIQAALSIGIEVVQRHASPEVAQLIVAEWAKLLPGGEGSGNGRD